MSNLLRILIWIFFWPILLPAIAFSLIGCTIWTVWKMFIKGEDIQID